VSASESALEIAVKPGELAYFKLFGWSSISILAVLEFWIRVTHLYMEDN
jgi:hypothetical protein